MDGEYIKRALLHYWSIINQERDVSSVKTRRDRLLQSILGRTDLLNHLLRNAEMFEMLFSSIIDE